MKRFYFYILITFFTSCNSIKERTLNDARCITQQVTSSDMSELTGTTVNKIYHSQFVSKIEKGIYFEIVGLKSPKNPLIIDFNGSPIQLSKVDFKEVINLINGLTGKNYIQQCKKNSLNHIDYAFLAVKNSEKTSQFILLKNSIPCDSKEPDKNSLTKIYKLIYPYYWDN